MDEKAKLNKKKMTLSENYGSSIDLVRNDLENYYIGGVFDPRGTTPFRFNRIYEDFEFPKKDGKRRLPGDQAIYNIYEREERDTDDRPRFKEGEELQTKTYFTRMQITASDSFFGELTSSFKEDGVYEDSYFEIGAPIEYISNVDNKSIIQGDVSFDYNYGSASYEFLTNQVSEQSIPNFYETPTGSLRAGDLDDLVGKETVVDYIISNADYYNTTALQQLSGDLPFFNMVSFTNPTRTDKEKLSDAVIDGGLSALFCDVLNLVQSEFFGLILLDDVLNEKEYTGTELISSYNPDTNQTEFSERPALFQEGLQKYDLSYFIETIKGLATASSEREKIETKSDMEKIRKVFGKNELNAVDILRLDNMELDEKLASVIGDFQNIIDNYSRNFEDILAGVKPYCSDVLFYSIEKYEFGSSTPIQTFWVPSVFIYLGLDYIDLQVKYGKKYTYKVYAYKITLDTRLEYTFTVVGDEERIDEPPDDEPPETKGGADIDKGDLPREIFETVKDFEDEFGGTGGFGAGGGDTDPDEVRK
jgi:hypothetical protein